MKIISTLQAANVSQGFMSVKRHVFSAEQMVVDFKQCFKKIQHNRRFNTIEKIYSIRLICLVYIRSNDAASRR